MSHSLFDELGADQQGAGRDFDVETSPTKHEDKTYPSPSWPPKLSCFDKAMGIPERPWVASGVTFPAYVREGRPKVSQNRRIGRKKSGRWGIVRHWRPFSPKIGTL